LVQYLCRATEPDGVWRGNVPRYYFNIITANGPILDHEGTELRDLDRARSEAIADARSLMSTAIKEGHTIFGRSISICNEAGEVLAVLPFSEAVKAFD
jgi:hypothetical protein